MAVSTTMLDTIAQAIPAFAPGSVWLVGAGPGDPALLTAAALSAVAQADVAVYDALVGPGVIGLFPSRTELVYAGKRGGKPSAKQKDITKLMIDEARAGKRVLRLKGGDPFIFGRGGEEALALTRANVPFHVVPGVTAAVAGAANAGIPITHRDTNSSVTFVTGHNAFGEVPDALDWSAISRASPVLVFYMAIKHLEKISDTLIANGRSPHESVAVISNATLPSEQLVKSTLSNVAQDVRRSGIEPPAIVVVGPVVNYADILGNR